MTPSLTFIASPGPPHAPDSSNHCIAQASPLRRLSHSLHHSGIPINASLPFTVLPGPPVALVSPIHCIALASPSPHLSHSLHHPDHPITVLSHPLHRLCPPHDPIYPSHCITPPMTSSLPFYFFSSIHSVSFKGCP